MNPHDQRPSPAPVRDTRGSPRREESDAGRSRRSRREDLAGDRQYGPPRVRLSGILGGEERGFITEDEADQPALGADRLRLINGRRPVAKRKHLKVTMLPSIGTPDPELVLEYIVRPALRERPR